MPVKVLANNTYSADLGYWENEVIPVPNMYSSAQRFCTAAEMLEDYAIRKHPDLQLITHLIFCRTCLRALVDTMEYCIRCATSPHRSFIRLKIKTFDILI